MAPPRVFCPLSDRILVRPDRVPDRSPGGIFYPGVEWYRRVKHGQTYDFTVPLDAPGFRDHETLSGLVVRTGFGFWTRKGRFRPVTLAVGLRIVFPSRKGSWLLLRGVRHVLLREEEVLAYWELDDDDLAFPLPPS